MKRTVACLMGAVCLVGQTLASTPIATAVESERATLVHVVHYDRYLSPNADGRHDKARVVFLLARRAAVRVVVRDWENDLVRVVHLGKLDAGRHVWRWGGGSATGEVAPDGRYSIGLDVVRGDTRLGVARWVRVLTQPDAGRLLLSRPVVYPKATAVVDRLDAVYVRKGYFDEIAEYPQYFGGQVRLRTRLVIKDPEGQPVVDEARRNYRPSFSWSARNDLDQPLAAGDYRLRLTVRDPAGNVRTIRRTVEVSWAQLVEESWTSTTPAALTADGPSPTYDPSCNGCGEICEAMPSERFPDGLSFRQPCEFGYAAREMFGASPPFAPAPVDSWRVSATGGPTTPDDTDVGSLSGVTMGPGETTVTTAWQPVDLTHHPFVPDGTQPAVWSFSTTQDNDYDIAAFTVEYRHWVPVP